MITAVVGSFLGYHLYLISYGTRAFLLTPCGLTFLQDQQDDVGGLVTVFALTSNSEFDEPT